MHSVTLYLTLAFAAAITIPSYANFSSTKANNLVNSVPNPLNTPKNMAKIDDVIKYVKEKYPTCRPNVCFALDGSGSITSAEFDLQKGFVILATVVLGGLFNADFAAVEYGILIKQISGLTSDLLPPNGFLGKVNEATIIGSRFTFIGPGLQFCISEFERSPQAVNKIILLGDGRTNFGDNLPFGAPSLARQFLQKPNNKICAGLVGNGNFDFFKELVGGDESLVLRTSRWTDIINILRSLIDQICN